MVEQSDSQGKSLVERLIKTDEESPKRILILGDCMWDTYIQGTLYETCQEGCPKFIQESIITVPGGAANAARSLENWNCEVVCLPGKSPYLPNKVRFMVGDKCIFRYDDDLCNINLDIVRDEANRVLGDWQPHAVLLSDYDKGILSLLLIHEVVEWCQNHEVPCVADCKRHPAVYGNAILKGNYDYFNRYVEQARTRYSQAVTTTGFHLPVVWDKGNVSTPMFGNLRDVKCINHVGAGDCFAAHMVLALAHGFSLKESAALAHSAGRVYVQSKFNKPPTIKEIELDFLNCKTK